MKNLTDVLRQKEAEFQNLQREIEALRLAIRLCSDGEEAMSREMAGGESVGSEQPVRGVAVGGDRTLKQFP